MKFLHLGDLHIGKTVGGYSMTDVQEDILNKICGIAADEKADAVIISGDVYDKDVPSARAVNIFDDFIVKLSAYTKIYIISGNHDSAGRLAFANRLLDKNGIYICGEYNEEKPYEVFKDEYGDVKIYMLPYLTPYEAKRISEIDCYGDAVADIVGKMGAEKGERNIIAAHLFVTHGGSKPQISESEFLPQNVGTIDGADASVFDCFSYAALGHLHRPQHIGRREVRYSGSPICYSRSEAAEYCIDDELRLVKKSSDSIEKSVPAVTIDGEGNVDIKLVPLDADVKMYSIKGSLADICRAGKKFADENPQRRNDYVYAVLNDEGILTNAAAKLRTVFPNAMPPVFENRLEADTSRAAVNAENIDLGMGELFKQYYKSAVGKEMSEKESEFIDMIADMPEEESL